MELVSYFKKMRSILAINHHVGKPLFTRNEYSIPREHELGFVKKSLVKIPTRSSCNIPGSVKCCLKNTIVSVCYSG